MAARHPLGHPRVHPGSINTRKKNVSGNILISRVHNADLKRIREEHHFDRDVKIMAANTGCD